MVKGTGKRTLTARRAAAAVRVAAARLGVTPEQYYEYKARGLKFCGACRAWLKLARYGSDATKRDGKQSRCLDCANEAVKRSQRRKVTRGLQSAVAPGSDGGGG